MLKLTVSQLCAEPCVLDVVSHLPLPRRRRHHHLRGPARRAQRAKTLLSFGCRFMFRSPRAVSSFVRPVASRDWQCGFCRRAPGQGFHGEKTSEARPPTVHNTRRTQRLSQPDEMTPTIGTEQRAGAVDGLLYGRGRDGVLFPQSRKEGIFISRQIAPTACKRSTDDRVLLPGTLVAHSSQRRARHCLQPRIDAFDSIISLVLMPLDTLYFDSSLCGPP